MGATTELGKLVTGNRKPSGGDVLVCLWQLAPGKERVRSSAPMQRSNLRVPNLPQSRGATRTVFLPIKIAACRAAIIATRQGHGVTGP